MSRNKGKIEKALKDAGIPFKRVEWHIITKGPEMCGPEGGWVLVDTNGCTVDWLGYNVKWALETVAERKAKAI